MTGDRCGDRTNRILMAEWGETRMGKCGQEKAGWRYDVTGVDRLSQYLSLVGAKNWRVNDGVGNGIGQARIGVEGLE